MKQKIVQAAWGVFFLLFFSSCADFLNVNPDDVLLEDNYPSTITELYSGYMGIAASVQAVADKASFLEGLRGDLLEPTMNSTREVVELYQYTETSDNKLANPVDYYKIILNANDYIEHASTFFEENPTSIDEPTYTALIGGAIRYKTWAYLMLAKIYGQAIWIDDPLIEFSDINQFPLYDFNQLILQCIDLIENGIELNGIAIDGRGEIRWSAELFPGQGESSSNLQWNRICPPAECLLAELYLFAENYPMVIENALAVIRMGGEEDSYQLNKSEWNGEWVKPLRDFYRKESIFMFTYDYNLHQTHHLIDYYSNLAPNKYLMRPSQVAMNRFRQQVRSDGNVGDNYRGDGVSFKEINGDWVFCKFTRSFETPDKVYRNDVLITLYKASDIHLWLAEALGQLGRFQEALAFLNGGIETYFNTSTGVFMEPFDSYPASLYRTNNSSEGACQGVRGRVSLNKVGEQIIKEPMSDVDLDKRSLDLLLIDETCLESAGEARALYTMMRIAKRWNDPSILANRVSAKYPDALKESIKAKLMDPTNWFIKYSLQEE
ncbi:MAG: hypothetical protein ACERKD_20215 [Prolixibacteraceae bacterium]